MKKLSILIVLFLLAGSAATAAAQSLKPQKAYPLGAGINQGTSDSLVGTHYWYFYAEPGNSRLTVRFKKAGTLYGTELNNNVLTVTLTDEGKSWRSVKVVSSKRNQTEAVFAADNVKRKMKIIVSIAPPNQNLVRMGGDYEIEATGAVQFDEAKSAADPIVRTYESKVNAYGSLRFLRDGRIEASDGSVGEWKSFDPENRIYSVQIGRFRWSVQYLPGYGLVKPDEPNLIVFQELRR